MLADLRRLVGRNQVPELLGIPVLTVRKWEARAQNPPASGVRAVWLVWCLLLHPEKMRTAFDVVTWGRFRVEYRSGEVGDWSI